MRSFCCLASLIRIAVCSATVGDGGGVMDRADREEWTGALTPLPSLPTHALWVASGGVPCSWSFNRAAATTAALEAFGDVVEKVDKATELVLAA